MSFPIPCHLGELSDSSHHSSVLSTSSLSFLSPHPSDVLYNSLTLGVLSNFSSQWYPFWFRVTCPFWFLVIFPFWFFITLVLWFHFTHVLFTDFSSPLLVLSDSALLWRPFWFLNAPLSFPIPHPSGVLSDSSLPWCADSCLLTSFLQIQVPRHVSCLIPFHKLHPI